MAQYEADDIIGTLGRLAEKDSFDVTIVSGDKDLIQLTDEHTVDVYKRQVQLVKHLVSTQILSTSMVAPLLLVTQLGLPVAVS